MSENKFRKGGTIIIDADGCPVVIKTTEIAAEFGICCVIVADSAHIFSTDKAEVVIVSQGADSADFYIVNHIKAGDLVVTQDYGLAAMCMAKKAVIVNQDGKIYDDGNIDGLLTCRAINKKARRQGKHIKGPSKRTEEQNIRFEKTLRRILENAED